MRTMVVLCAATAFALTACGSSHAITNERRVQQALAKSANAISARVAFTVQARGRTQRGSGVLDNRDDLAQIRLTPTSNGDPAVAVLSGKSSYYRFPGQGWLAVNTTKVSSAARVSDLEQPEYLLSYLDVKRVAALGNGHFRVWASDLAQPVDLWIASSGYITQLHTRVMTTSAGTVIETVKLFDFGQRVHLTIPEPISNTATANADGSFAFSSSGDTVLKATH